jgi:hypothetical protein
MGSIDELVKRLTSKGDVGASLLGFVLAYLLELKFTFVAGLSPGTAGSLGTAAAVGLKNVVEAAWSHSTPAADRRKALENVVGKIRRIDLNSSPLLRPLEELRSAALADHEFWSSGLITDDQLQVSIDKFIERYRAIRRLLIYADVSPLHPGAKI